MGNSGWTNDPTDITIPADAGPNDVRIFIGQNDPMVFLLSADNGIVFYYGNGQAFTAYINRDDANHLGVWNLRHLDQADTSNTNRGILYAQYDWVNDQCTVVLGDGLYPGSTFVDGEYIQVTSYNGLPIVLYANGGGDIEMTLGGSASAAVEMSLVGGDFTIDGVSASRGRVGIKDTGFTNVNFTPVGTQVTGGFAPNNYGPLLSTRRYQVIADGTYTSTVAGDTVGFRTYEGSIVGTLRRDFGIAAPVASANVPMPFRLSVIVQGSGQATNGQNFSLGVRKVAGGGTCTVLVNHMTIEDMGPV